MIRKDNGLHMPFAEWLFRMHEADLAAPGRVLAIYAAVYDITGNEELAALSGIKDRTLDKWKKFLVSQGWVLIEQRSGGRGKGILVHPAYLETPVTFTDLSARNPSKFYDRNNEHTPAIETGVNDETPAAFAGVSKKVPPTPPSKNYLPTNNLQPSHLEPSRADAMPGEERVGGRVFVNCETVRHPAFTLHIPAIAMQLVLANTGLCKVDAEKIAKDAAIAHALQWGAEIDAGKHARDVVPNNPANFIRGSIVAQRTKQAIANRGANPTRRPRY